MDKQTFIDRISAAESAERKAAPLPNFCAEDTTSTTQTLGSPAEAFERNFKANHGEIIRGIENIAEFLKSKGCKKRHNRREAGKHFQTGRRF